MHDFARNNLCLNNYLWILTIFHTAHKQHTVYFRVCLFTIIILHAFVASSLCRNSEEKRVQQNAKKLKEWQRIIEYKSDFACVQQRFTWSIVNHVHLFYCIIVDIYYAFGWPHRGGWLSLLHPAGGNLSANLSEIMAKTKVSIIAADLFTALKCINRILVVFGQKDGVKMGQNGNHRKEQTDQRIKAADEAVSCQRLLGQ